MKYLSLLILGAACCFNVSAMEPTDSTDTFVRPDSVKISRGADNLKVEIYGGADNPSYYYSYQRKTQADDSEQIEEGRWDFDLPFMNLAGQRKSKRAKFEVVSSGLEYGFVGAPGAPGVMDVKMGSSYEIAWENIIGVQVRPWRNGTAFMAGFGMGWKNYRMTGGHRFADNGGRLELVPFEEGTDPKFSRIKIFSLKMPVMFSQELGRGFQASAGIVVNFNVHGSMKTKYEAEGEERVYGTDDIHQQKVTVDLKALLGYKGVGVYVKYSPNDVLDRNFGPEFKHLSTGVSLFF